MDEIGIAPSTDAEVIAGLHAATVGVAYRGFFPEAPPPTADELRPVWESWLEDPTALALVATTGGRPVGSVLARANREFGEGELAALHVLPAEWGRGVGGALHDAALTALAAAGHWRAGLWVIAANERARGMYERRGWVLRPEVAQQYLGVTEVRYFRNIP